MYILTVSASVYLIIKLEKTVGCLFLVTREKNAMLAGKNLSPDWAGVETLVINKM